MSPKALPSRGAASDHTPRHKPWVSVTPQPHRAATSDYKPTAVIVAAVVAFVLGALWYGPFLFGKAYLEVRAVNRPPLPI